MLKSIAPVFLLLASGCAPELPGEELEGPWGNEEAAERVVEPTHCVVTAETFGADPANGPVLRPPVRPPRCFKLFSEAISFATQGQVVLPESASTSAVETALDLWERSGDAREPSPRTHVIATEYTDKGYRGASLTVQSEASCATTTISLNLPETWNKAVSSARVFGDCRHAYHYENKGMKGARADCDKQCSVIGNSLSGRTSSIQWTK